MLVLIWLYMFQKFYCGNCREVEAFVEVFYAHVRYSRAQALPRGFSFEHQFAFAFFDISARVFMCISICISIHWICIWVHFWISNPRCPRRQNLQSRHAVGILFFCNWYSILIKRCRYNFCRLSLRSSTFCQQSQFFLGITLWRWGSCECRFDWLDSICIFNHCRLLVYR